MKILYSEATPDYAHYLYPYVIWGFLEPGEAPADAFGAGFMPGTPTLDRWYLARQIRVPLREWVPTSENRRVLRKAAGLRCDLVPKAEFTDTPARRDRWLAYAAAKWGPEVMPAERLDRLMKGPVITHLLHFTDPASGVESGTALVYCEPPRLAFYYYAFYEHTPATKHIGMAMMTQAVEYFRKAGYAWLHLGTCYSESALYKAQFEPLEFWNGIRWSRNVEELKHLIRRPLPAGHHRLETPEFLDLQAADLTTLAVESRFWSDPST